MVENKTKILQVEGLTIRSKKDRTFLLKEVSFSVAEGEILGILGESGSGKSLTGLAIMGLLPEALEIVSGAIYLQQKNLLTLTPRDWQSLRGKEVSIILQDPLSSLNPVLTIGEQIEEVLVEHLHLTKRQAKERTLKILAEVGIPQPEVRMKGYPHQLSGGMRQRAMIAMALSCNPKILIADEPTTALDPTLQLQILELLKDLNHGKGLSMIFITHDLGVMRYIAHRILVYYQGEILEEALTEELFREPLHPYTSTLFASYPGSPFSERIRLKGMENKLAFDDSCPYFSFCPSSLEICPLKKPSLIEVSSHHWVRCYLYA